MTYLIPPPVEFDFPLEMLLSDDLESEELDGEDEQEGSDGNCQSDELLR